MIIRVGKDGPGITLLLSPRNWEVPVSPYTSVAVHEDGMAQGEHATKQ